MPILHCCCVYCYQCISVHVLMHIKFIIRHHLERFGYAMLADPYWHTYNDEINHLLLHTIMPIL